MVTKITVDWMLNLLYSPCHAPAASLYVHFLHYLAPHVVETGALQHSILMVKGLDKLHIGQQCLQVQIKNIKAYQD